MAGHSTGGGNPDWAPPGLSVWARAQRTLQRHEAWLTFRDWIDRENPRLAYGVARNLALASTTPEAERPWAALMRAEARARLAWRLPARTILCMPTTPFPAPPKGHGEEPMIENGDGFGEIHAHRVGRRPGPGIKERRIRLEILTLGRDLATVHLEFKVRGHELIGRQSQTWVRFPDVGWKVIAAHVSTMNTTPLP